MKKIIALLFAISCASNVWCDNEITIMRSNSKINSGFRERIYIDGREVLVLANGVTRKIVIPDGSHTIYAELYTLTTGKLDFDTWGGALNFVITPYTTRRFIIEKVEGISPAAARDAQLAIPSRNTQALSTAEGGVEGSLIAAAEKIKDIDS